MQQVTTDTAGRKPTIRQLPAVIKQRMKVVGYPFSRDQAVAALKQATRDLRDMDCIAEVKAGMDKSDMLASFAKAIKDTELEKDVRVFKNECWEKIGMLLLSIPEMRGGRREAGQSGSIPNPDSRTGIVKSSGISSEKASYAMRLAATEPRLKERLIQSGRGLCAMASELPARGRLAMFTASFIYREIANAGFSPLLTRIRKYPATQSAQLMTKEEAVRVRAMGIEISEWLDEFLQHLPKTSMDKGA